MLLLLNDGKTQTQIADFLGCSINKVGCGSSEVNFYHETAVIPTDSEQNNRAEAGNYSSFIG
jgi:hypothetical protein